MTELTAETIVNLTIPDHVQLSPNEQQIAYTLVPCSKKDEHATSTIWLASTSGNQKARQFTQADVESHHPRWSPDGKQIAFLSDRARRGTAQLYTIAVDGGEAQPLTALTKKQEVQDFAWSPQGGQIAFTSADEPTEDDERREKNRDDAQVYGEKWPFARLRLFSLASREVTTLVHDERHIAALVWSPDGKEIAYIMHQTPSLEASGQEVIIKRIALAGGEPQVVCRFPLAIRSLHWSSDGHTLYFLAPIAQKKQSSEAVYAVAANGGDPQHVIGGETNCVTGILPLQHGPSLAILFAEGLGSRLCQLNTESGELTTLLPGPDTPKEMGYFAWDVSKRDDSLVVALVCSSGEQAFEVWAGRTREQATTLKIHQRTEHQEMFAGISFGKQESFSWTAADGQVMDGLLIRPPDATDEQPLPMVVLVHGGPYGRWEYCIQLHPLVWGQWLALAGYAVLLPNPRGGSGHGETFAAAARGGVGKTDFQDIMDAVDAAIERGIADPTRLGIGGWSHGGFMAAWAITQTRRFKAAVMGAGISDWGMMVMEGEEPDVEQELGGSAPWDGEEQRRHLELSPITYASRIRTPILILHGENDECVPLSQATGFHRALRKLDVPVVLVTYPREPHILAEQAHLLDVLQRVRSWYDRWLQG